MRWTIRRIAVSSPLLVACTLGAQQSPDSTRAMPIAGDAVVIGRGEGFSMLTSAALLPDGDLIVADGAECRIFRYRQDGSLAWAAGRKGQGPGEFQLPYRLAATADGTILVYDEGTRQITWLDSTGMYLDRRPLGTAVRAVGNMVSLPGGEVAFSGIVLQPRGAGKAIHVFDASLQHVRSFGSAPEILDPRKALNWGAGYLTLASDGDLLFTRKLPYEVYKYSPGGELRWFHKAPYRIDQTGDDAFVITVIDNRITTTTNRAVPRPRPAFELLDGYLVSGLVSSERSSWDLIAPAGSFTPLTLPGAWEGIAAVDRRHRALWVYAEIDDSPVFLRVPLRAAG